MADRQIVNTPLMPARKGSKQVVPNSKVESGEPIRPLEADDTGDSHFPRSFDVGLVLPQMEGAMDGGTPRWNDLSAMANLAETVGFDSIWVIDHLLVNAHGEEIRRKGLWECWSLLAALAATTTRVKLGSLVTATSLRNPALLAKIADTVDEISNGRLILGLGAGSYQAEHYSFGYSFDHQVSRFEEALIIIRMLLQERQCDFTGTYYTVRNCELRPQSRREGVLPILIGTLKHGKRMLRLVAEHADMWNVWLAFGLNDANRIPPLRAVIDSACRATGRDPATLKRTATVLIDVGSSDIYGSDVPMRLRGKKLVQPLAGTPEKLAHTLRAFASEGISHVQISLSPNTLASIETFAKVIELLRKDLQIPSSQNFIEIVERSRSDTTS